MHEKDVGGNEDGFVNDDKMTNIEVDEKGVEESSRSLSFREKIFVLKVGYLPHFRMFKSLCIC